MNFDLPVPMQRYGNRPLWLLIAAAAARYSAERDAAGGMAGFLFWALVFAVCWNLRDGLRKGKNPLKKVEQAGNAMAAFGLLLFLLKLMQGGDIVLAVLALLFAGQAALLLIAEKRLHIWLLLGAALAAVLFAASASRSALFLPCAAWFTFAALGLLTADYALERSLRTAAQPVEEGAAQRFRFGSGTSVFALLTLALGLPLYLFMPRPDALMLGGMQAVSGQDYSDYSERGEPLDVHPEDPQGKLRSRLRVQSPGASADSGATPVDVPQAVYQDSFPIDAPDSPSGNGIVMYVQSTEPVYLRGKLYDRFEDNRWFRDQGTPQRRDLERGYYESGTPPTGAVEVKQQIEVAAQLDASLYAAPGLHKLRFPGTVLKEYPDGTLELPRRLQPDTIYSVESQLDLTEGRYLLRQERLADEAPYLQLPADFTPRIRALAQQASAGADGAAAKALALERYLRSEYQYSFDTIIPYQGVTPLDWFLFEHKRGHCEFFASAVVVMLRSLGIPARVATGFSLGEKNPVTGFHEVRVMDGHAWGEVYLAGRGWMMLKPTPFYPLPVEQPRNQVAAETDRYLERMADTAAALDPHAVKTAVIAAASDTWHLLRALQWQLLSALQALGWWLPALLLGAAILALCVWLLRLWLLDWMHNRRVLRLLGQAAATQGAEAALHAAAALEQSCDARDAARPQGTTFREFCARLRAQYASFPAGFAEAFDDVRYGGAATVDTDGVAAVSTLVREQLRRQPRPRFSRQLRSWYEWLPDALRGVREPRPAGA